MMTDEPESRKDRTTPPNHPPVPKVKGVTEDESVRREKSERSEMASRETWAGAANGLKFGPLSLLLLVALAIYQVAQFDSSSELTNFDTITWLAAIWAGWAISIWLLVRQPISLTRAIILGGSLGWHCMLLALHQGMPPERYLVLLGCYGLMQSVASVAFSLPTFRFPKEAPQAKRRRPQFGILTISCLTTGLALVMFAARRYAQIGGDDFIANTLLIMASLLMVSLSAIVISHSQLWWSIGIGFVIFTASVAATLMVVLENLARGGGASVNGSPEWFVYLAVVNLFGVILHTFGTCGKWDAIHQQAN